MMTMKRTTLIIPINASGQICIVIENVTNVRNAIYGMHAIRVCVTIIGRYHHIRKDAVTVLSVKFLK